MAKKSSYSLIATNPKLTGNVKLVVDSKDKLFIETIDSNPELSRNKYKANPVNDTWVTDLYNFYTRNGMTNSLFYEIGNNEDFISIKSNFKDQYYKLYSQGADVKISKEYNEQLSYFVPTWFEPLDIPEYFAIFKIQEPTSVNSKSAILNDNDLEKTIYNDNYIESVKNSTNQSTYFFDNIISKSKLLKVFSLKDDTNLGKYLRKHLNDTNFPEGSIYVNFDINNPVSYNGISLNKSGFTTENVDMWNDIWAVDRTVTEFDNMITNGFSKNNVVHPNIINMEFLFDDEDGDNFTMNRYYGVYFNRADIASFSLNTADFFYKKLDSLEQNSKFKTPNQISIYDNKDLTITNQTGVKLYIDYKDGTNLLSNDIQQDVIPYVYSVDDKFYDINQTKPWNNNEIILKDTTVNLNDFKGYTNNIGVIPCNKNNYDSKSSFNLKIVGDVNYLEVRIRYTNNLNRIFIGDKNLDESTFESNKFSLKGTPTNILKALTNAINYLSNLDDSFNVKATNINDSIVIYTIFNNEHGNSYKFDVITDESNKIKINFTEELVLSNVIAYSELVLNSLSTTSLYKFSGKFAGGSYAENKIIVPIEYFEYFKVNLFLETKEWYSKIISINPYLDEPVYFKNDIVEFKNYNSYLTICCESNILLYDNFTCKIFDIAYNKIGLMSIYPLKCFDTNQFYSDYSKKAEFFKDSLTTTGTTAEFKDLNFKTLCGVIDETTKDIPYISNEYDRLSENELAELGIGGRIIPFINKWVYDNDSTDVRENNYRLTNNSAFSFDNFSPSYFKTTPNTKFFTHDWYYLSVYPGFFTLDDKLNSFSYFNEEININSLKSINTDYFDNYFTSYYFNNGADKIYTKPVYKYSYIVGGSSDSFAQTMFRGAKLMFKRRSENKTVNNFNYDEIITFKDNSFNNYKFSCVLTNTTDKLLNYTFIENKKYKNITLVIECNLDDYHLNNYNGIKSIDRSSLYFMNDKLDAGNQPADSLVLGSITLFDDNTPNKKLWSYSDDTNLYTIVGVIDINGNLPQFDLQITSNESFYNDILVDYSSVGLLGTKLEITDIKSVTSNTIVCGSYKFTSPSTGEIDVKNINVNNNAIPDFDKRVNAIYKEGGRGAYTKVLELISFASIFQLTNEVSPAIKYETIDENGVLINNDFIVEFLKPSINSKIDYLKPEQFTVNNDFGDFKPIGSKLSALSNSYISPMFRLNGLYNPKVNDVFVFSNDLPQSFIDSNLLFKNVKFFSTYKDFAKIDLYINKINKDKPNQILKYNSKTTILPKWWRSGDISLDITKHYIFRSSWDYNYYKLYQSKTKYLQLPGYVEPNSEKSYLSSTIMNIPNLVLIDTYLQNEITSNVSGNNVNIFVNNKLALMNRFSNKIKSYFEKYINSNYNYNKLDTLDDDVQYFVDNYIFYRYLVNNFKIFVKYVSKTSNESLIASGSESYFLNNGFFQLKNFNSKTKDLDLEISISKEFDKNIVIGITTELIVV